MARPQHPVVEEELDAFALSRQPPHGQGDRSGESFRRIIGLDTVVRSAALGARDRPIEQPVQQGDEQVVDGLEVEEDEPAADARFGRDGAGGDAAEPLAGGEGVGGAEDGVAALLVGLGRARHASSPHSRSN